MKSEKFNYVYKKMYDKIEMSKGMDEILKKKIMSEQAGKKAARRTYYKAGTGIVAAAVILVCLINIKTVSSAMNKVFNYFFYSFEIENDNGSSENIEMTTKNISFSKNAPKTDCRFNSVKKIGDRIGIKLLESENRYKYDGCIQYTAEKDEHGNLIGALISDDMYSVGDLKNISVNKGTVSGETDLLNYKTTELYKSPIMMQISIRNDTENSTDKYTGEELSFASKNTQIDLTGKSGKKHNAEVYNIKNLKIKAVLFDDKTDGPTGWGYDNTQIKVTIAVFVYNDVEYIYSGGVNHETMKKFLDSLS